MTLGVIGTGSNRPAGIARGAKHADLRPGHHMFEVTDKPVMKARGARVSWTTTYWIRYWRTGRDSNRT
jgi:hypothetical protein